MTELKWKKGIGPHVDAEELDKLSNNKPASNKKEKILKEASFTPEQAHILARFDKKIKDKLKNTYGPYHNVISSTNTNAYSPETIHRTNTITAMNTTIDLYDTYLKGVEFYKFYQELINQIGPLFSDQIEDLIVNQIDTIISYDAQKTLALAANSIGRTIDAKDIIIYYWNNPITFVELDRILIKLNQLDIESVIEKLTDLVDNNDVDELLPRTQKQYKPLIAEYEELDAIDDENVEKLILKIADEINTIKVRHDRAIDDDIEKVIKDAKFIWNFE